MTLFSVSRSTGQLQGGGTLNGVALIEAEENPNILPLFAVNSTLGFNGGRLHILDTKGLARNHY